MGIVARQGIFSGINVALGFFIGAVNTLVLVPLIFFNSQTDKENWGIVQLIVVYGTIFSQFLNFGSSSVIVRMMPSFRSTGNEKQILFFTWVFPLVGSSLLGIFLFAGSDWFFKLTSETPVNDVVFFSVLLFVIFICMNLTRSLSGLANSNYKTVWVAFVNELFIRILNVISMLLYFYEIIDIRTFFIFYSMSFVLQFLLIFIICGHVRLFQVKIPPKEKIKEASRFGLFSMFDHGAGILINKLDITMIAAMIGLVEIAYYNLAFFMSTVIVLPYRALANISSSVVSDSYHRNDWKNIDTLYKKNSLNQTLAGGFIFILVWTCIDNILETQPEEFEMAKYCFLFLGISKLIDAFTSINGIILQVSKYYVMNFVFNVALLVLAFITNLILIPDYGIIGAAIATAGCIFIVNILKSLFLYNKYKVHPFHSNMWIAFICLGIPLVAGMVLPEIFESPIISILFKGTVIAVIFSALVYFTRVSEEINIIIDRVLVRVGIKR